MEYAATLPAATEEEMGGVIRPSRCVEFNFADGLGDMEKMIIIRRNGNWLFQYGLQWQSPVKLP
jgi:hypothetical protein